MAERPVVLVDMDGVIADFDGEVTRKLRARISDFSAPDPSTHFYYTKRLSDPQHITVSREIQAAKGFFRGLQPIEGALDGWRQLEEMGYRPRICSSPLSSNLWCTAEKLEWLKEHLGSAVADTAIIDKDKSKHDGIALIDDRPIVDKAESASWQHVMFAQPYNQHIETNYRLNGWNDPKLATLMARCVENYERLRQR